MSVERADAGPELLLKGGHVVDPGNGLNAPLDVAVAGGKVVRVGPNLPTADAAKVIDVTGYYVTPGVIDMHAHVATSHRRSHLPVPPELHTFTCCVTTVADAGTVGWKDFLAFKEEVIDRSKIRIFAYVNIVGQGMVGAPEQDVGEMSPRLAAAIALEYPDVVVGIKAAHYWTREPFDDAHPIWASVDRAVEAGELCHKPVMVDFWPRPPERPYPDLILKHLRPGDIHTHVFAQQFPVLDERGKVSEFMYGARERGVIFDLGHGAGSFWFRNAVPAIQQGFVPDSISTDLHTGSINGPVFDMLTCMNKMLNMGVPLEDVIARSTVAPAREIGHPDLGTLSVGSDADVAVLKLETGSFPYVDCGRAKLIGHRQLRCALTLRAGQIVYNRDGLGLPEWQDAPDPYWWDPGQKRSTRPQSRVE